MDIQDKIKLAKENLWNAIDDYKAHTNETCELDNISDTFVANLAESNAYAKQNLRNMFRKSPAWNEELDAIIINGTRTHNPNYYRVYELAEEILTPIRMDADDVMNRKLSKAISFFTRPKDEDLKESIAAIQSLAPDAYAPRKKYSRIFKALCDALKVSDNTAGSDFQRLYAMFADEISSRKIPFKLFVSLSPSHFFSMSNPKDDDRGDMLLSCHSFNSEDDEYVSGCSGYARDKYSFIVFTATNPDVPETLNNRKNSRQIFAYKPGNGLLLQSRLYNSSGGTTGAQEDSTLYRDLIQREISDLEGAVNLWKTYDYVGNPLCTIEAGTGFGGYQDWEHKHFSPKISIREDHKEDFLSFTIGTYGLCISCGDETRKGRYCSCCKDDDEEKRTCDNCCQAYYHTYPVWNDDDQTIYVCAECRSDYYTCCDECSEYYPDGQMTEVQNGAQVCPACLDNRYTECHHCQSHIPNAALLNVNDHGDHVMVCEDCRKEYYSECSECGDFFHKDEMEDGLCPACLAKAERDAA